MALKSKKNPAAPAKQVLQVNPYEIKDNVLELMSKICAAEKNVDYEAHTRSLFNLLWDFEDYYYEHQEVFSNYYFKEFLDNIIESFDLDLETCDFSEHTKVAVAGGFSSGKSSFLNRLTNQNGLLPTGTEPVSVVLTYLYCSSDVNHVKVQALNHKDTVVELNTDVLQAIQHSNTSNVYLASVMKKLYVRIPSRDMNNLVFIDTPGYNNSNLANKSNGMTDCESALLGYDDAKVLFWFISSMKGTISKDDMNMIKKFKGPVLVIFSKADQKDKTDPKHKESKKIVTAAYEKLVKEIPAQDIIDVISYSTFDNEIYFSKKGHNHILDIVKTIKNFGNDCSFLSSTLKKIKELFDTEIENTEKYLQEKVQEHTALVEKKNNLHKKHRENQDASERKQEKFKKIIGSYIALIGAADKICKIADKGIDKWKNFIHWVIVWDRNRWNSDNQLEKCYNRAQEELEGLNQYYEEVKNNYPVIYNRENIKDVCDEILQDIARVIENDNISGNKIEIQCMDLKAEIAQRKKFLEYLKTEKMKFSDTINNTFHGYYKAVVSQVKTVQSLQEKEDIFKTIQSGDLKKFMHCFEKGLDLNTKGPDGYNVFTYAVMKGDTEMVKFLLSHNANPRLLDSRGFSAFHTAIECHNTNICKQILDIDPDILYTTTQSGLDACALMELNAFSNWLLSQG